MQNQRNWWRHYVSLWLDCLDYNDLIDFTILALFTLRTLSCRTKFKRFYPAVDIQTDHCTTQTVPALLPSDRLIHLRLVHFWFSFIDIDNKSVKHQAFVCDIFSIKSSNINFLNRCYNYHAKIQIKLKQIILSWHVMDVIWCYKYKCVWILMDHVHISIASGYINIQ